MNNLFQRNFDEDPTSALMLRSGVAGLGAGKPLPQFSESEVEQLIADAKDTAFSAGKAEGLAEARSEINSSLDMQVNEALQTIRTEFAELSTIAHQQAAHLESEMINLALGIAERIIPELLETHGSEILGKRIQSGMRLATGNARVKITTSDELAPIIQERLETQQLQEFNQVDFLVIPDSTMSKSSARVTWENGYYNFSLDRVCDEIRKALRQAAASFNSQSEEAK